MKALNRKSSITSLPQQNSIGGDSYETSTTRGSMPPEQNGVNIGGGSVTTTSGKSISSSRAKSMSKEPGESTAGQTMPSRFFSLSRRLGAKIRFSSSSQPPVKQSSANGLAAKSATNLTEELKDTASNTSSSLKKLSGKTQSQLLVPSISVEDVALQQQQQPKQAESVTMVSSSTSSAVDQQDKKNLRERALSPSRIFRSLRPRSPFGRSTRNSKVIIKTIYLHSFIIQMKEYI